MRCVCAPAQFFLSDYCALFNILCTRPMGGGALSSSGRSDSSAFAYGDRTIGSAGPVSYATASPESPPRRERRGKCINQFWAWFHSLFLFYPRRFVSTCFFFTLRVISLASSFLRCAQLLLPFLTPRPLWKRRFFFKKSIFSIFSRT